MLYRITGIPFYYENLDTLLSSLMKRSDAEIEKLNDRLIVKRENGIMKVLFKISVSKKLRNVTLIRARRS